MPNAFHGSLTNYIGGNSTLDSVIQDCLNLKCFSIGFDLKIINKKILNLCKKNNLYVTVYSEKNINYSTALDLWDLGVESIFINNPSTYQKELNY